MRMSNFIIGLIVFSLISAVGVIYLSSINTYYPLSDVSNISSINSTYNKLIQLENLSSAVKNKTESVTAKDSWLDILGGFFGSAYSAVKLTTSSVTTATDIGMEGLDELPLTDESVKWFQIALGAIIFIMIFVGVILSVLTRREL